MASARFLGPTLASFLVLSAMSPAAKSGEAPRSADRGNSFILSRGEYWSISSGSLEDFRALKRRYSGDFLWASRRGRAVVIRDRQTLAEAVSLFDPLREIEPDQRAFESRQRDLEGRQNALEREQEKVDRELDRWNDGENEDASSPDSEETRRSLEQKRRELESQERALESKERELEAQERSIDERSDELERQAEAKLWVLIDRAIADGRATDARER